MRKTLPHFVFVLFFCFALYTMLSPPACAQTWTDDGDLAFLLEVNGVSAADSDEANQIPVNLTEGLTIELTV
ncbi:MAG: hypothetical protein ACFE8Z_10370, partial [Candidatus Hermodarchaeota archaeon]